MRPQDKLLVIGAGVVGLSTALEALDAGFTNVTIVAEQFSPNTTSDGAGALWRPVFLQDTPQSLSDRWAKETLTRSAK